MNSIILFYISKNRIHKMKMIQNNRNKDNKYNIEGYNGILFIIHSSKYNLHFINITLQYLT